MATVSTFQSVCLWNRKCLLFSLRCSAKLLPKPRVLLPASVPFSDQASGQHHAFVPCAEIHTSAVNYAGHNKWSKVKHIKGPKDAARSRMFARLSILLRFAVREGGSNPEFNTQLANVIEQCRAKNMPKVSIEAAIKGAKSKASTYSLYEGRGPGGLSMLIEILTDNNSRSHQEIKSILNKNGGALCEGARHCFERKGVVTVNGLGKDGQEIELERALELAIEAGAEDVKQAEDEEEKVILKFVSDMSSLREVRERLSTLGLLTITAGPEFIPTTTVQLTDRDLEAAFCLIELIDEYPDVIKVYDNIESQS
ncbi:translational activator of cytochrome c oxidase 1-like [Carcharodon carcharias]|uniref:translational activator of cytochrome c oxidase 1-like n=1 Tax=Carcharodon carcharias TaxID=13397 RepID=UPI001B7DCBFC|nr:translational activator of cytochrome c oxidase 1-like [Carcharodon carcharias]XP_041029673.1 translational activator of cytochrome c oxidase 1-like [Carcharodon carcharias]